jgi:hypothetical protein
MRAVRLFLQEVVWQMVWEQQLHHPVQASKEDTISLPLNMAVVSGEKILHSGDTSLAFDDICFQQPCVHFENITKSVKHSFDTLFQGLKFFDPDKPKNQHEGGIDDDAFTLESTLDNLESAEIERANPQGEASDDGTSVAGSPDIITNTAELKSESSAGERATE